MDQRLRQLIAAGREHYERQEYDKAEPLLEQATAAGEHGFADVYNMLGVIRHVAGRFQQAQDAFERALAINPTYTEAALNLAVTYNDLGRYRDAAGVYSRVVAAAKGGPSSTAGQLDPFARGKLANMHADIGDAYFGLGLLDDAEGEYRRALALCPQFPDLRTRLAQTLRDAGRLDEAVKELLAAKDINPHFLPARISLGLTLFSLGRKDEAAREWEAVLVDAPDNKTARMYLRMTRE